MNYGDFHLGLLIELISTNFNAIVLRYLIVSISLFVIKARPTSSLGIALTFTMSPRDWLLKD